MADQRIAGICSNAGGTKQPGSLGFGLQNGSQNRERCHERNRASHLVASPAVRLIGTPRKRTISAEGWVMDNQANVVGARPSAAERPQESGAAALGRGGRMSRQRKTAAVLRLLRGEDLETVSRELGVTAATLTGWHDAFLAAGKAALTTRATTGEELESDRLKARLGAALIERDLLHEKIALLEVERPFARRRHKP